MAYLTNRWIKYIDRTYQQIKSAILVTQHIGVPEITDDTESNPFVKIVSVFSGIAEMLGYYIDNAAREAYIGSCRLFESGVKLARVLDYRIRGRFAATVDLTFTLNVPAVSIVNIPIGTLVTTADGIKFFTTAAGSIAIGQTQATVPAVNSEDVAQTILAVSDGTANQEIVIGTNILDNSCVVHVGADPVAWTNKNTLGRSISTDKHYVFNVNEDSECILIFGDNVAGIIPLNGADIKATYKITDGVNGNVGIGKVNTLVSVIVIPSGTTLTVSNVNNASGGADIEDLIKLKSNIPKSLRTLDRAVTRQDFIDIAELAAGVAKAAIDFVCGQTVDIYIYPDGGGVASSLLIADTLAWMSDVERKVVGVTPVVYAAGQITIIFAIYIRVKTGYSRSVTSTNVTNSVVAFFDPANQKINGGVELGDIYQAAEDTDGVEFSRITVMTPVPYAKPVDPAFPVLSWVRTIKPASAGIVHWKISMTTTTQFELYRNDIFQGIFTVNVMIVQFAELDFKLNPGSYAAAQQWTFVTYGYFGNIQLEEMSIPTTSAGDITITAEGGVV